MIFDESTTYRSRLVEFRGNAILQVRILIHKDREGHVGMKKEPYSRVSLALKYRIKDFVTHPNCQQVD